MKKLIFTLFIFLFLNRDGNSQQFSVGEIEVEPSVGAMGQAQMSMPIFCSPGRQGATPQLSVNYSSSAGNGTFGYGYSLTGVSVISRSGRNFHLDGEQQEAIGLNSSDKLTLDGERLILVQGSYFAPNSVYRTENDKFLKVTFTGTHFVVDLKNGGKLFFGITTSSTLEPINSGNVLSWYLDLSFDAMGNYIRYIYTSYPGEVVLSEIQYSGFDCSINSTVTCGLPKENPFNKVVFEYENTNYNDGVFIAGFETRKTKVVKSITSFADNVIARRYFFEYAHTPTHAKLTQIREVNMANEELPPVNITWNEDGEEVIERGLINNQLKHYRATGDFDGDGAKELLQINGELNPANAQFLSHNNFCVILKYKHRNNLSSPGFFTFRMATPTLPTGLISGVVVADVDADGDDDILLQYLDVFSKRYEYNNGGLLCAGYRKNYIDYVTYRYHVLISEPTDAGSYNFSFAYDYFGARTFTHHHNFHLSSEHQLYSYLYVIPYMGDIDGDGLPDLILRQLKGERIVLDNCGGHIQETAVRAGANNVFHIRLSTRRNNATEASKYIVTHDIPEMNFFLIDFNGNGKLDLFNVMHNNQSEVFEFDNNMGGFKHIYGTHSQGFPTYHYHKHLTTGDFNGDGKTDLLYYINNAWHIAYSNGLNFVEFNATQLWFSHNFNHDYCTSGGMYGFNFEVGDFNGDGRDDIVERHNHLNYNGHSGNEVHVYYSMGIGFEKVHLGQNPRTQIGRWYYDIHNIVSDFDGDGKSDILLFESHSGSIQINRSAALQRILKKNYKITRVQVSAVNSFTFEYNWLPQSQHYRWVKSDLNTISMAKHVRIPLRLVTTFRTHTTGHRDEKLIYTYKNLLHHLHGRGIMGFMESAVINEDIQNINKTTISRHTQNAELPHQLDLTTVEVFNHCTNFLNPYTTGVDPISKTTYEYSQIQTVANNDDVSFSCLSLSTEIDLLRGLKRITCYEYDIYGNLIHTASVFSKNTANADDEYLQSNDNLYAQHGSWIPSSNTITRLTMRRYNTNRNFVSQQEMEYTPRGLLKSREHIKHNLQYYFKEVISYDRYGNIISTGLDSANNTAPGLLRIYSYKYTAGRFMREQTNPFGHITEFQYEPIYGNLIYNKENDGSVTTINYDAWGNEVSRTTPDNITTTQIVRYNNDYPNVHTKKTITTSLNEMNEIYYDAKGRKIREHNTGFKGVKHGKIWNYDTRGFLTSESNLFDAITPSNLLYHFYFYDRFGRKMRVNYNNSVNVVAYSYNQTETIETYGNGETKRTVIDATGTPELIQDNGGTISYRYNAANKPISISNNGVITQFTYNDQMNKISMNDPNAGLYQYDYNAFGELLAQLDPLGNEFKFDYDALGRLVRKHNATYEFIYTYNNSNGNPNNNKLVKGYCLKNGNTEHELNIEYNPAGLISRTTEMIAAQGNQSIITNYKYDGNDRLEEIAYPNIIVKYHYDNFNNLEYITDVSNNQLWQKNSVSQQGSISQISYGNNFVTNFYYNQHDLLTGIRSEQGNIKAIDMQYNFALNTSNLLSRRDLIAQQIETFDYDNLNRLTTVSRSNLSNVLIESTGNLYQANGNITDINNGDLQKLAYSNTKRNAAITHRVPDDLSLARVPNASFDNHIYTFNEINRLSKIIQDHLEYDLNYGFGEQRIESKLTDNGNVTSQIFYLQSANMEFTQDAEITYLFADGMPFAMHRKDQNGEELYYLHTDYQKSILAISNSQGQIVERRNYDAWGRPRDPNNLSYSLNPFSSTPLTLRGYTFHEHLNEFSLINMNARLYDPVMRRVISPDALVVESDNTQAYNRYSYCFNNPLKYTDPDGNEPITIGIILAVKLIAKITVKIAAKKAISAKVTKLAMIAKSKAFSSTMAGSINMMSNTEFDEQGWGWEAFGNFAAGFIGAYVGAGVEHGAIAAFNISGGLTLAVNGFSGDIETPYDAAQLYVGGGLSGIAGVKSYTSLSKTSSKGKFLKSAFKNMYKYGNTAIANAFAYDDEDKFFKKPISYHIGIYAGGAVNGLLNSVDKDMLKKATPIVKLLGGDPDEFVISSIIVLKTAGVSAEIGFANLVKKGKFTLSGKDTGKKFGKAALKNAAYLLTL